MRDVMVDLETLGTVPGCSVLSIGAVAFDADADAVSESTYGICILRSSCLDAGLFEDVATIDWWAKQDPDVAQILDLAQDPEIAVPLSDALTDFSFWLAGYGPDVRIWGNGADFDNPILAAAYRAAGIDLPWESYSGRCYRTLKNLRRDVPFVRIGSHHNAVDDAVSQAAHAVRILRDIAARPLWKRLLERVR